MGGMIFKPHTVHNTKFGTYVFIFKTAHVDLIAKVVDRRSLGFDHSVCTRDGALPVACVCVGITRLKKS